MQAASALTKTDWGREWQALNGAGRTPDSAEFWNQKAVRCRKSGHLLYNQNDSYVDTFINYANLKAGESVLDIGCGPGALAIPLAKAGHSITAVDFSQKMLAILIKAAHGQGALDITPVLADWRDDWDMKGIEPASVAIASRSIAAADLKSAVLKVNDWALRRACISTAACGSPFFDRVLSAELGRHVCQHSSFAYCMNILFSMDLRPELRFIDSPKDEQWSSREAAVAALRRPVEPLTASEQRRFVRYLDKHLVEVPATGGGSRQDECLSKASVGTGEARRVWKRDYTRIVEWAFIAWDKPQ
jgi:SAM-dependent methyltransferase